MSLDLGAFSIQLIRLDSMEYLDLAIAKESGRTESALCAISGKKLGKESVLTVLVPKKPVAESVGSINVGHRVVEKTLEEDKNEISTYKTHDTNEDVRFW